MITHFWGDPNQIQWESKCTDLFTGVDALVQNGWRSGQKDPKKAGNKLTTSF